MRVYLDNTATSWPKPKSVVEAITDYMVHCGASPGRSGHRMSLQAAHIIYDARDLIAKMFNAEASEKVIFTANATLASNIALKGILKKGDHAIISHLEHNSTLRPLKHLEQSGLIDLSIIDCDKNGNINIEQLKNSFRPNTKIVATIHGSNVIGKVLPIAEIGAICKTHSVLYMIDAAQTAGFVPIDMQAQHIDILTFTGHKKLYGPSGTGGLCFGKNVEIDTFIHGGSGSKSEIEFHPDFYPDKLEAGTPNTVGIAGLKAGLEFIFSEGIDKIRQHSHNISKYFIDNLLKIDEIKIHGYDSENEVLPVISVTSPLITPSKFAEILDKDYEIMTRPGLHCAPLAHKAAGTFPQGTLRFSPGYFNTQEEIDYTIKSLKEIL